MTERITERFDRLDAKLDTLIRLLDAKPDCKRYLTAKEVGKLTGLDARTILNRSNLPADHPRYIPSLRFGSRRKFFDRRVIERLFTVVT